ncbi:MAG: RpiB/LacA/LacB family sugar-phosphate isomerase [bacterium]|nr:RpiB/LacA/LacB family sugar-phosphate isomerase [bacterium]
MKVGIASDHRGYKLKKVLVDYLKYKHFDVIDYGTDSEKIADYTKYGFLLGEKVASKEVDYGIAICGSGIGISIVCNKVKGIRCAKVDSVKDAYLTKKDNDANIIALNGTMPNYKAKDIVDKFFETDFSNTDRYIQRIKQITNYEETK